MSLREINRIVATTAEAATRGGEFLVMARCMALARGDMLQAAKLAENRGAANVASILEKAAAAPGTLSDQAFANPLAPYALIATAFAESLRHSGAFDAMLPSMLRIPLRTKLTIVTTGAVGSTVSESAVKPISKLALANNQLDALKAVAVVALTEEVLRLAGPAANDLLGRELRSAVAISTDIQFLALITAGIATTPQTGLTPTQIAGDIGTALGTMTLGSGSRLFMLTSGAFAAQLSVMMLAGGPAFPQMTPTGGALGALTVVATDAVSGTRIVIADSSQIAAGSDAVTLDSSREALLQMDNVPDSPPTASTTMLSLWQTNMTGLRAERWFGAQRLRAGAVAVIQ